MYKYTIQFAVPGTVKSGPDFVKWLTGVVEKDAFTALAEYTLSDNDSAKCIYHGRWKPSAGVVEAVRVYSDKPSAAASLKKMKELYVSSLAKPVFGKVESTAQDFIDEMYTKSI